MYTQPQIEAIKGRLPSMWEYSVHYVKHEAPRGNITSIRIDNEFIQFMAKMGLDGWELVASTPNVFAGTYQGDVLYFKRPKQQTNNM